MLLDYVSLHTMQDIFCRTHTQIVYSFLIELIKGREDFPANCRALACCLICLFVPLSCNVRECEINFVGVIQLVVGNTSKFVRKE